MIYVVYNLSMGAGKGKVRRVNAAGNVKTHVDEKPKPKLNFGDEVKIGREAFRHQKITVMGYNNEKNTYYYISLPGNEETTEGPYYEDEVTLKNSKAPSQREQRLKDCLHKRVVFHHRPDASYRGYAMDKLDGQIARIISVYSGCWEDSGESFDLDFYEVDQSKQPDGVGEVEFCREDFRFLDEDKIKNQKQQQEEEIQDDVGGATSLRF